PTDMRARPISTLRSTGTADRRRRSANDSPPARIVPPSPLRGSKSTSWLIAFSLLDCEVGEEDVGHLDVRGLLDLAEDLGLQLGPAAVGEQRRRRVIGDRVGDDRADDRF